MLPMVFILPMFMLPILFILPMFMLPILFMLFPMFMLLHVHFPCSCCFILFMLPIFSCSYCFYFPCSCYPYWPCSCCFYFPCSCYPFLLPMFMFPCSSSISHVHVISISHVHVSPISMFICSCCSRFLCSWHSCSYYPCSCLLLVPMFIFPMFMFPISCSCCSYFPCSCVSIPMFIFPMFIFPISCYFHLQYCLRRCFLPAVILEVLLPALLAFLFMLPMFMLMTCCPEFVCIAFVYLCRRSLWTLWNCIIGKHTRASTAGRASSRLQFAIFYLFIDCCRYYLHSYSFAAHSCCIQ